MGIKIHASAYIRPLTKEIFEPTYSVISFSGDSYGVDESVQFYWDDYLWEEYPDLSKKSLYKFEAILDLTFNHYSGWGYDEYSEEMHVDKLLFLDVASDFKELREVVTLLLDKKPRDKYLY